MPVGRHFILYSRHARAKSLVARTDHAVVGCVLRLKSWNHLLLVLNRTRGTRARSPLWRLPNPSLGTHSHEWSCGWGLDGFDGRSLACLLPERKPCHEILASQKPIARYKTKKPTQNTQSEFQKKREQKTHKLTERGSKIHMRNSVIWNRIGQQRSRRRSVNPILRLKILHTAHVSYL